MQYATPEQMGVRSSDILRYVQKLEKANLATHSVLIARHGHIIFEKYWAPYKKNELHRIYSATKSFVAIAIGFLAQDGLIDLDAPIIQYFPEEAKQLHDPNMRRQTIRHMLMMATAKVNLNWFLEKREDRVAEYFINDPEKSHPPGTVFAYDSTGSFVLGALVERLTGKKLLDYLREKCLDKLGFSKEAYMLTCPGGHSWSDSALLCTPMDWMLVAQFMLQGGSWNGEQLLNREFVALATGKQIETDMSSQYRYNCLGYGYQFWMCYGKAFYFSGSGVQIAMCVPEKDMVLVITSDDSNFWNSRTLTAGHTKIDGFFDLIVENAADGPVEDDSADALEAFCADLKLPVAKGSKTSPFAERIDGVTFALRPNPMEISWLRLNFENGGGTLTYQNAQGEKQLPFRMGENVLCPFPQDGYYGEMAEQVADVHYRCAVSAAWLAQRQFSIMVQIIDKYFGRMEIRLAFDEELNLILDMDRDAERILNEYKGRAQGRPAQGDNEHV